MINLKKTHPKSFFVALTPYDFSTDYIKNFNVIINGVECICLQFQGFGDAPDGFLSECVKVSDYKKKTIKEKLYYYLLS